MRPRNSDTKSRSWLWSKWFMGAVFFVFLLLTASLVKEFFRNREITDQIESLKTEIEELELANQENAEFVEYLKTDLYLEEQARIKLGLKTSGEKMIVLQDEESQGITQDSIGTGSFSQRGDKLDNVKMWMNYFWGSDQS